MSAGSVFSRLSILLLYFIAARALVRPDYAFLAYIVGVSAFLQIVFDPSSLGAFVVAEGSHEGVAARRALLVTGVKLVRLTGLAIVALPAMIAAAVNGRPGSVAVGASVGFIACGESVARFSRTGWQMDQRFRHYAGIDVLLGMGRLATGLVLVLAHDLLAFALANLLIGLAWQTVPWVAGVTRGIGHHGTEGGSVVGMARRVWPYSASYLSASIYSNGPAVIVGLLGGVAQGALYSIVSRMTQPTELVPQALSAVNLPRLTLADEASRPALFRRQALQAGLAGIAVAAALLLSAPLTLQLFRLPFGRAFPLLVILAAILPLKFLSYQLVALLIADGRVRARLRASAFVAGLSVAAVCAVAWNGAVSAAAVTLGCECLLVTLLYLAARTTAHTAILGDSPGGYGSVAP